MKHRARWPSAIGTVITFIAIISSPEPCFGSGSFEPRDIKPLLNQRPALARAIEERLELATIGQAMRLGPSTPALAGYRVAPYQIEAKPKGEQGPFTLLLSVDADTKYLDAKGKPVAMARAVAVKEKLTDVCLLPLPTGNNEEADPALEDAMRQYIRAINRLDAAAFLKLVSSSASFSFVSYNIDSLRKGHVASLTAESLAADLKAKKGDYLTFFDPDTEAYSYRVTVMQTPFKKWLQAGTTFAAPVGVGLSYVRWRKESGSWILDEIGDTTP